MDAAWEIQQRLAATTRYNRWLYESFSLHLGTRILDAGCGPGHITQFLLDNRSLVIGLDRSARFHEVVKDRFAGNPNFRAVLGDLTDPSLPEALLADRLDTVVCVNVLQQVVDDVFVLAGFHRALQEDGKLILLVPALRRLFGAPDLADHHVRRYSRGDIEAKLARSGFTDIESRWLNLVGIAGWFLNARILRKALIPETQYAVYDRLVPIIRTVEDHIRVPVGLSLLCIGRKGAVT